MPRSNTCCEPRRLPGKAATAASMASVLAFTLCRLFWNQICTVLGHIFVCLDSRRRSSVEGKYDRSKAAFKTESCSALALLRLALTPPSSGVHGSSSCPRSRLPAWGDVDDACDSAGMSNGWTEGPADNLDLGKGLESPCV